jgi:hypothetical protein
MNHPFTFIKSRAWRYFVHWSLWMFTLDEMRMKAAFTPFTLDESSAMHIQSVKCKFALSFSRRTLLHGVSKYRVRLLRVYCRGAWWSPRTTPLDETHPSIIFYWLHISWAHHSEGSRNAAWGWQFNAETCRSHQISLINWKMMDAFVGFHVYTEMHCSRSKNYLRVTKLKFDYSKSAVTAMNEFLADKCYWCLCLQIPNVGNVKLACAWEPVFGKCGGCMDLVLVAVYVGCYIIALCLIRRFATRRNEQLCILRGIQATTLATFT